MRHQTVYPITNFKFGQKSAKVEKDTSVSARMSRMRNKYETEGPRRSVEAVLVVHQVREEKRREEKRSGGKGKINNTRRSEQERDRERETERETEREREREREKSSSFLLLIISVLISTLFSIA